ncbi:hypothetical protein BJ322DRAFT_321749 [Thelephora terrestris]|uniref:Uncharacterized protein n=1 Tax=Thelephora terrestris TaxID=56493 RepID=A0A9P6H6D3_9AGAM|nr:hypothetical protein BJ322DRAFT_321749 [Thelephora terrestris]
MESPLNQPDRNKILCSCVKCARKGGKLLARSTWFNHNPGGKKARRPNLSLAEIDYMLSLPAPKFSKRRKLSFRGELKVLRARVVNRAAESSTRVRRRIDITETSPEILQSARPAGYLESERAIPPLLSDREMEDAGLESLPPPLLGPITHDLDDIDDLLDGQMDPPVSPATVAPISPAQDLALDPISPLSLRDDALDIPVVKKTVLSLALASGPPGNDAYPAVAAPAPVSVPSSPGANPGDCDDSVDVQETGSASNNTKKSSKKSSAKKTPKPRAKKITARSLCLEEWEKEHGAVAKGFEAHWRARTPEQKKAYETRAKELTETRKQ